MNPEQEPLQFLNLPVPRGKTLKPYQREDLERMLTAFAGNKAIYNGNIMGAGKCCETMMWAQYDMQPEEKRRFVIICPGSAVPVWAAEIDEWSVYGGTVHTVIGGKSITRIQFINDGRSETRMHFVLCSFDLCYRPAVLKYLDTVMRKHSAWLIIDEAHHLGNINSKRSRAVLGNLYPLATKAMFLSGSINRNRLDQLYPVWHTIAPKLFPSYVQFIHDYCATKENPYNGMRQVIGGKNKATIAALGKLARKHFLIRQPAKVVEAQLPDLIEHKVYLECPNMQDRFFQDAVKEFSDDVEQETESEELAQVRQDLMCYKLNPAIDWINQLRAENDNCPLVLFAYYQQNVEALYHHYDQLLKGRVAIYYGPTKKKDRTKGLQGFQKGDADIFIASYAAAEAISLTRAAHCVVVEMAHNRMSNEQAPKRIHRIGQKSISHVYYLLVKHTIDQVVYDSYRRKVSQQRSLTE